MDTAEELSAGVLEGVAVRDDGTVTRGVTMERVSFGEPVASVWCLFEMSDGSVLVGTGLDGKIYRWFGGSVTVYAETGGVAVTGFARGEGGEIFAAVMPDGKVFRLVQGRDGAGRAELVARLPGAEHVWAIEWDARRRELLCATGPEGKLFAVDPRGRPGANQRVLFDSVEPHLYAMAQGRNGEVFLGAGGNNSVVYGLSETGVVRVVARVDGDEVRAVAVDGDALWVVANDFAERPSVVRRTSAGARQPTPGGPVSPARPRPGEGSVYRISPSGLVERYWRDVAVHGTAGEWDASRGEFYVGLGVGGRILAFRTDRSWRTLADVDERQVLALGLTFRTRVFATADGASLYRVSDAQSARAVWTSRVLDATVPSRWGAVAWRGEGSFEWESRSGNTEAVDDTWSPWVALSDNAVRSPGGRYLQVRARFGAAPRGEGLLRSVTVYYLPENQRAVLTEVSREAAETKVGEARPSVLRLRWKVENPDRDSLRYRLRFRREGESSWRAVLHNREYLTETRYDWPLEGLPEGWYRVEVEASDEGSNPVGLETRDRRVADPLLVDVTAPRVTVRVGAGRIEGEVHDGASAVTRVEVSVDGGEWRPVGAVDGVFDEREERFGGALEGPSLSRGEHTVAVRAWDEADNVGVASVSYRR